MKLGGCLKFLMKWRLVTIEFRADGSLDVSRMVVINHESKGYLYFNFLVTVCCLVGSYVYVYMAAHRI